MQERHADLGPVLGGTREGIEVVLSTDSSDDRAGEVHARAELLGAVTDTLVFNGFAQRPESIELERVTDATTV